MINNPVLGPKLQLWLSSREGGVTFLQSFLPRVIILALIIGSIAFVAMLVMGAIQWIMSGGDKGSMEAARGRIANALVGIVILFAVFAIIKLIEIFFGLSILTIDIGSLIIR